MDTELKTIDPAAAERVALNAEMARLSDDVSLYSRAEAAVAAEIATIQTEKMNPIRSELAKMRAALKRVQTQMDVSDYLALAPSEEGRRVLFMGVQGTALASYRRAQSVARAPKETIEREWTAVIGPFNASKAAIGLTAGDGIVISQTEHEAIFYKKFVAIARRMDELASLQAA